MDNNQNFKCTGDCLKCLPAQRSYCACQHAYSNMKVLDALMGEMISQKETIKTLSDKIEAIQNNEALVFDPDKMPSTIAQEGIYQND